MEQYRFPNDDERAKMTAMSPMSMVESVQSPTLILLGQQDRRVPNYQALNWHYALKSNGVQSMVYSFPDTGHAMDSPEAEKYAFEAIIKFLDSRLHAFV